MDSYVVRIYRRNSGTSQNLVGLVEFVEADEEKAFTSFEELREILSSGQRPARTEKNREKKRG